MMIITNETTTWDVAELMGSEADELDGRIMMGLLLRDGYPDTEEISPAHWHALLVESQEIRERETTMRKMEDEDAEAGWNHYE